MINNWLTPLDSAKVFGEVPFTDHQLGSKVHFYSANSPDISGIHLAIIGMDHASDLVRAHLYRMSNHKFNARIIDMGNLVNTKPTTLLPVLKELKEASILPILIGAQSKDLLLILNTWHKVTGQRLCPAIIDDRIGVGKGFARSYLNPLFEQNGPTIDYMAILAYQEQYSDIELLRDFFPFSQGLRLGALRADIKAAEPYLRDADFLFFMLNALKHAEAPAQNSSNPSGLYSEEACQLAKYAGLNEKIDFLALSDYDLSFDEHGQTAELIAQVIWYFIYGIEHRADEYLAVNTGQFVQYMVNPEDMEDGFVFYKSEQTGRWWVSRQTEQSSGTMINKLRACSYEDYIACTHNEISERLMELFQHSF